MKAGLGVVGVNTSYDDRNRLSAPTSGVVGQAVFLHFGVVGFQREVDWPTLVARLEAATSGQAPIVR